MPVAVAASEASHLPRVLLKPRRALPFFGRHPWVFKGAIHSISGSPAPGDEVALATDHGEFIARGLFNPDSNIVVRLCSWDPAVPLDDAFFAARLDDALALRRDLLGGWGPGRAVRLVASEGDGLSGLTVDRYDDWLLVQLTSRALATRQELLVRLLQERLAPQGIWLRTEKGIREQEGLELADGLLAGVAPPRPLFIEEHGVRYGVDLIEGQKTGFYLDQRENRAAAARWLTRGRVLDVCCYSGGFALNVARNPGVTEVVGIDVSEPALTLARANAELNSLGQKLQFRSGDAFKSLEQLRDAGERFSGVILDPPKLARRKQSLPDAIRGYKQMNRVALQLLEPGGILVTCSCTGHVSRELFEETLAEAAREARRPLQILENRGPAPDHPVSVHCLESHYLKCYIARAV